MGNSKAQNAQKNSGEHISGGHISGGHILAFDFSASRGSLCLWSQLGSELGGQLGRGVSLLASRQALTSELSAKAEILPALLDAMLSSCGVAYASLQAICFVRGPGSYTGLRASLAVAKGLRLAHQSTPPLSTPLATYSLTSFEAALLAMEAKNSATQTQDVITKGVITKGVLALALVESFHDIWYAQAFRSSEAPGQPPGQPLWQALGQPLWQALGQPQALDDKKLAQLVTQMVTKRLAKGEKLFLCGAKATAAAEMLEENAKTSNLRDNLLVVGGDSKAEDFSRPLAERLATRWAAKSEKAQQGINYASGAEALLPLYIGGGV